MLSFLQSIYFPTSIRLAVMQLGIGLLVFRIGHRTHPPPVDLRNRNFSLLASSAKFKFKFKLTSKKLRIWLRQACVWSLRRGELRAVLSRGGAARPGRGPGARPSRLRSSAAARRPGHPGHPGFRGLARDMRGFAAS